MVLAEDVFKEQPISLCCRYTCFFTAVKKCTVYKLTFIVNTRFLFKAMWEIELKVTDGLYNKTLGCGVVYVFSRFKL